ncbi:GTP cyclohydrolase II [Peribacillus frigoritolerans]|uniref:GTP cyclohydrolase II n=1 Tax=Peribacillus frigoritolerans TaxID=450367 RepID=UPI0021A9BD6E|nr:GTP cyclohydrolase II [Peribacillus frigoritolerans]MCT4479369.1 GTP cyclohydrolase II [Peribacillus frigoritolerans]
MKITEETKNLLIDKMNIIKTPGKADICLVGPVNLPVEQGDFSTVFQWYTWLQLDGADNGKEAVLDSLSEANLAFGQQSSVLVYGDFKKSEDALVRMHSICHTGDIFGSKRCDCGYQLHQSMKMIAEHGCGAIFYLADHEGRGIGLFSKSLAYLLQQEGYDTVEANEALGFEDDTRSYEGALRVLRELRKDPVTLITNNPKKLDALMKHGLAAKDHIPLWGGLTEDNSFYLDTKVKKSGHIPQKKPTLIV